MPRPSIQSISQNIALRRAWVVLASLMLWAQLAAAAHHHVADGDSGDHRAAACELCLTQASPAAPSAEASLPSFVPQPLQRLASAVAVPVGVRTTHSPHAPRAPPSLRHA
jgi:hypothetical protein